MSERARYCFLFCLIACLVVSLVMPDRVAAVVRRPAWAGTFYPGEAAELTRQIERFMANAATPRRSYGRLRALIMPHAGYRYSGATAAHAAAAIHPGEFDRVVLIGPDHRVGFSGVALTAADRWQTPLGLVPIDTIPALDGRRSSLFSVVPASDRQEHSLEVILPFLQMRLAHFKLIPMVLGPCAAADVAAAIDPLITNPGALLVVSADLSHHLPGDQARERDRQTLGRIMDLDPNWQADQENRTCGRYPVGVLLVLARQHHWRAKLLHYSHSGEATGDHQSVVGYGAVAFYGGDPMQHQTDADSGAALTSQQGEALVALARRTLETHFKLAHTGDADERLDERLKDSALSAHCGTFVTLKIRGQLRGCIGSLSASAPMVEGVRDNARNAAFHDPRFPPLSREELGQVAIEVSVLTDPMPLEYRGGEDLLAKLRPGLDGVIIRKGYARATFLPQVWEQLPRPEQFLAHLCMKAGLPADQWRQGDLEVQVYQVQYFEEAH